MSEYVCCVCGRPATVRYTQTINGETKVSYYCDECARSVSSAPSMSDIISSMFNNSRRVYKPNIRVCKCGTTEHDVLNSGKFGCSECYSVFKDIVDGYMNSRGYSIHKGKVPIKYAKSMSKVDVLKQQLDKAVKEMRYLDADKIAKQINELEKDNK